MKTKYALIVLCWVVLQACGDTKDNKEQEMSNSEEILSNALPKQIEALRYEDYALSLEAEAAISEWEKYQELAIQVNYLKQGDISFFNGERDLLADFVLEFRNGIPEDLNTNPISSRVSVVLTALLKLNDDLTLDNIKNEDKLNSIKSLLISFSNLNFQINKKLERDLFDSIQPE